MKSINLLMAAVAAIFCTFTAHAEEKTDVETLTATLTEAYGTAVTVDLDGSKCNITYPEVVIEDVVSQYTEPKKPGEEPKLEAQTVTTVIPTTTAQCSKIADFDAHSQYLVKHTMPHKILAQLYNKLGFAFIKDLEIKNLSEEIKIVPQLGFISGRKIIFDEATYTQKDETTGLKSEIGNLKKYELTQESSKEGDKLKYRVGMNMEMLNAVLPFFSVQIKSEKHLSELEYNPDQSFDYAHLTQNIAQLISAKSAAIGRGIKIGVDMFGITVNLDTEIKNNTQREENDMVRTYGTMLLNNIDITGNLISKEKQPKTIELKYSLKDVPSELLFELSKIQQDKSERMEKAESLEDIMAAKNANDAQMAELMDKAAETAKLTASIETKFDNAAIKADFVLERKNGYLSGIGKVNITHLYNIFPEQKKCLNNPKADELPECNADIMFSAIKDFADTSKDDSEIIYKYTEQGVFKNDVKIDEPIELNFKKMYQEKQQRDKEREEHFRKMMKERSSAEAQQPESEEDE